MKKTKEYIIAETLCNHSVELKLYDDLPYSDNKIVRVKVTVNEKEFGVEYPIESMDKISIGMAIDLVIERLMKSVDFEEGE